MSVYVDNMRRRATISRNRPMIWSHMFADTHEELMAAAHALGLRADWLQHRGTVREHFDVTDTVRARAVEQGAVEIDYPHGTASLLQRKREAL